jgi:chromosome condensin MukBEF ATPase and DNA-binding subunit MukB
MPKLSISQAAKLADIERSTLYRKRDKGEISFEKDRKGNTVVDLSELGRVYPEVEQRYLAQQQAQQQARQQMKQQSQQVATSELQQMQQVATGGKDLRIRELELENQAKDRQIAWTEQRVQELADERDEWRDQARRLLLTYQPLTKAPEKPVEAQNKIEVGEGGDKNTPQKANFMLYGAFVALVMGISLTMWAYRGEIRGFLNRQVIVGAEAHSFAREQYPFTPLP